MQGPLTLSKEERVCSKKLLDQLFDRGGKRSMVVFPLRAVYLVLDDQEQGAPVQIMVSVPKRLLHHAVDRNRVKRQIREAYRKNKMSLVEIVGEQQGRKLAVAFVWIDSKKHDSKTVESSVCRLIEKIKERL